MRQRRSDFEKNMDILANSFNPIRKGKLMKATHTNCTILTKITKELEAKGLMTATRVKLKSTSNGYHLLSENPNQSKAFEFQVTEQGKEVAFQWIQLRNLWRKMERKR